MLLENDDTLTMTALMGQVQMRMPKNYFEEIEVDLGNGNRLCVASPAMMHHLYGTRNLWSGKSRDWKLDKFNRLRKLRTSLVDGGIPLLSANDFGEWRLFRRRLKKIRLSRFVRLGIDIHDGLGRPLESTGLASVIR